MAYPSKNSIFLQATKHKVGWLEYAEKAAKQIQVWWKAARKQHFVKSMKRCQYLRRQRGRFKLGIRCWQRARFANIVREFIVDTSRSRFAIAMKRLRWCIVQAQRAAKSFLECRKPEFTVCFEFGSSASVKIVQSSLNYKRNKIIKRQVATI